MQKYRIRLRQERRDELRMIYGDVNTGIKGGYLHNRKTWKDNSRGRSNASLICPRVDQEIAK